MHISKGTDKRLFASKKLNQFYSQKITLWWWGKIQIARHDLLITELQSDQKPDTIVKVH